MVTQTPKEAGAAVRIATGDASPSDLETVAGWYERLIPEAGSNGPPDVQMRNVARLRRKTRALRACAKTMRAALEGAGYVVSE